MKAQGHQTVTRVRQGTPGRGIVSISDYYGLSNSSSIAPTTWVSETPPKMSGTNRYLWKYTVTLYSDGTSEGSESDAVVVGAYGDNGLTYRYSKFDNSGVTKGTTGWTTYMQNVTSTKKYLWNYKKITYSNSTTYTFIPSIIGTYKDTGVGIYSVTQYYLASEDDVEVTTSTTGWTQYVQSVTSTKKYLWNYTIITYVDSTTSTIAPSIIGTYEDTGVGISSVTQYYLASEIRKEAMTYRNDNNPYFRDENGNGFLDVVLEEDISVWSPTSGVNPPNAWICNETHTYDSTNAPSSNSSTQYWKLANSQQPIVSAFVLAGKIKANFIDVDSLIAKHIQVKDANDIVVADMGGDEDYPLFIGGETATDAITKFASDGTLTTTKLVAKGGTIGGINIGSNFIGISSSAGSSSPTQSGMSLCDSFISFTDYVSDSYSGGKYYTYIGTDVLSSVLGMRGLATFGANGSSGSNNSISGTCVGISSEITGFRYPYAWYCPEGLFVGFRPNIELQTRSFTLTNLHSVVVCSNSSSMTATLPSTPKHGQMYMLLHRTTTSLTVSSSTTHPIFRISTSNSGWATSHSSASMEVIVLWYDAYQTVSYSSATRTGLWHLTYIKV